MRKPRKKLTVAEVREIRRAAEAGEPQKNIALRLRVSAACVCRVLRGSRHKNV